ncbi:MAG: hypothetical protein ACFFAS_01250 [Promethearchaeota archaeon]
MKKNNGVDVNLSKEVLIVDRAYWENMRFLELKAAIMQRYIELEALINDDIE